MAIASSPPLAIHGTHQCRNPSPGSNPRCFCHRTSGRCRAMFLTIRATLAPENGMLGQ